ncbi:MAG: MmoB/DmpM family protein [Dongiaceae bacterium]|jgi:toluene monooxygenase system protein D
MTGKLEDFVGPIVTQGEISDAAIEAASIDNPGREVRIEEHASYVRVQARGECILTMATMEKLLGRKFTFGEFERNMPGFAGFIRTSQDQIRFIASKG